MAAAEENSREYFFPSANLASSGHPRPTQLLESPLACTEEPRVATAATKFAGVPQSIANFDSFVHFTRKTKALEAHTVILLTKAFPR